MNIIVVIEKFIKFRLKAPFLLLNSNLNFLKHFKNFEMKIPIYLN